MGSAVPVEDLVAWTEHSNGSAYKNDVLRRLHKARMAEFDRETQTVMILPPGIAKVESELLAN